MPSHSKAPPASGVRGPRTGARSKPGAGGPRFGGKPQSNAATQESSPQAATGTPTSAGAGNAARQELLRGHRDTLQRGRTLTDSTTGW